ncbi:monocarboxylate transporter 6 [Drosophila elegans]|uniref:monocarboxylate transporter 6 n=1 Tax=Drosophila elegans TaxID=30023 RepID=UPI0007E82EBB|nr:monocarboxylate transporter 6 [Drosophila elegans]XP_041566687.1 monocarboxylate transporter 6 [Drosophila elegans]XP_041566688.1 monocarboxylate transporter 6 [Drosophila elegans]
MTDNGSHHNNNNNINNNNEASRLRPSEEQAADQLLPKNGSSGQQPKIVPPLPHPSHSIAQSQPQSPAKGSHPAKKRRDKSDLGEDFVAPDGGWGWLVSVASGVNILVTFALAQQFGILFKDRMERLGISSSELTTIINTQIAVSAFTGLLNGPLFRRYTYRVVALFGSVLTFLGLFWMVFADTFAVYILSFSLIYGFGRGLTVSASSLAVNTYFKVKRRTATAFQFGVAGLGPIVCPYFATYMLYMFGVQGTTLLFAGASLHTIACSLIYQPVKWHVVKRDRDAEALQPVQPLAEREDQDEDIIKHVVEPETPVLPRANDGWFGSRASLNSSGTRNRLNTWEKSDGNSGHVELKRLSSRDSNAGRQLRSISVSHSIKEEEALGYHSDHEVEVHNNTELTEKEKQELEDEAERQRRKKLPFYMKVVIFFDMDLLRDITYVNLAVGITLINFVEINFAILTPFILSDLGFSKDQTALAMSTLGFFDLVVRFLIPLITAKINLSNRTFFVVGILGMCVGRMFLSITTNFYVMMGIFLWLGLNKAFRTVFWSLIIPSYVPLKRLPAAAGLQLLMSGTFSMIFGPLIGVVRDHTSYAVTLNLLNALCVLAIAGWYLEDFIRARNRRYAMPVKPTN